MIIETKQGSPGRRRVLKAGRVVFNNKRSVVNCVVRSIGDTGADVRLDGPMALPDDVLLSMDDHHLIAARRISQEGLNVVLEFV